MHKAKKLHIPKGKLQNCGNIFQGSTIAKEHCATERWFSGLDYQLMPKKKMSAMAWLECYPFFLVWVPEFQNTLRFLKTPGPGRQVFLQGTSFPSESYATVEALPASLNRPTTCKRIAQVITKSDNIASDTHNNWNVSKNKKWVPSYFRIPTQRTHPRRLLLS